LTILALFKSITLKPLRRLFHLTERFIRHDATLRKARVPDHKEKELRLASWWGKEVVWFPAGTPPRAHNQVTPLIDGENFFRELHQQLCKAKYYVFIAGWNLTPHFPICRASQDELIETRLLELLSPDFQKSTSENLIMEWCPSTIPTYNPPYQTCKTNYGTQ